MKSLNITKTQRAIVSTILIVIAFVLKQVLEYNIVTIIFMVATTLVAGTPVFKKAFSALRYKILGIDALVTIAVIGAVIIGEFWEAAAVTFLFMLGDFLEARTIEKTRSSIKSLIDLAPSTARVVRGDIEVDIPPDQVHPNDLVLVKSGEKIAVDGVVTEGYGSVDQATITGEPLPVEAMIDTHVFSGTILKSGYLLIRAQRVGEETTFARILHMVEEAQDKKAITQKFLEKFSRFYTPSIVVLSTILFLITQDLVLALTLLVIACPGALVISAPVSIVAGIGNGARQGVLVKGGEIMERLGTVKAIALDKTGTLTEGKPKVAGLFPLGNSDERELLHIAASGETYSEHPLARAIIDFAKDQLDLDTLARPEKTRLIVGQGLEFTLDGTQFYLGNRGLFLARGIEISAEAETLLRVQEELGRTAVLVGSTEKFFGVVGIADVLRPGAIHLVSQLRRLGISYIAMLTGDNKRTAAALSQELGLDDFYAELLPDDKVQVLSKIQARHGRTAMVGDGVNDAPALATADLGIAIGGAGSDIAMETADVVLMSSGIQKLGYAMALSRATVRNMKQNIVFALLVAGFLLAGVLVKTVNLSFGMLIHEVSVLLVILNALRLVSYKDKKSMELPS